MKDCLQGKILQVVLKYMFSHLQSAYSLLHHIGLRISQSPGHGQVVCYKENVILFYQPHFMPYVLKLLCNQGFFFQISQVGPLARIHNIN
jgi:hypothetical protein